MTTYCPSYKGLLTDAANHDGEEKDKTWWNAVDIIGVDAYYPILPNVNSPTVDQIVSAWQPYLDVLTNLTTFWSMPIMFTEIGYCSADDNEYLMDYQHNL